MEVPSTAMCGISILDSEQLRQEVHTHTICDNSRAATERSATSVVKSEGRQAGKCLHSLKAQGHRDSNFLFLFGTFRWDAES